MNTLKFSKYNGLGNDFILIDARNNIVFQNILNNNINISKKICNRNFGIGGDGIILILNGNNKNLRMKIINSDGTEAEMCGNGIRCFVQYIVDNNIVELNNNNLFHIQTLAGIIKAKYEDDESISVDMGPPIFIPDKVPTILSFGSKKIANGIIDFNNRKIEVFSVGMGNPHCITFMEELDKIPLEQLGSYLETHKFFPEKTNVHFVNVINKRTIQMLVWERGCGLTMACGTGACAVVVTSIILNLTERDVEVKLPGGNLNINWPSNNDSVYMKGPAKFTYRGEFSVSDFL